METLPRTLCTPKQVAERLACSPELIYKWVRTGQLPALRVGRSIRIDEHDLAEHLLRTNEDDA